MSGVYEWMVLDRQNHVRLLDSPLCTFSFLATSGTGCRGLPSYVTEFPFLFVPILLCSAFCAFLDFFGGRSYCCTEY